MREIKYRVWDKRNNQYVYDWQDTVHVVCYCFNASNFDRFEAPVQSDSGSRH